MRSKRNGPVAPALFSSTPALPPGPARPGTVPVGRIASRLTPGTVPPRVPRRLGGREPAGSVARMPVVDVTDATFETEVLERSKSVTVVVDLWAEWCGPCRTLGPILEKVVDATEGKVVLAKVDTDANPGVAQAFRVQSIPAVYALRDGAVVDGFVGALPEH